MKTSNVQSFQEVFSSSTPSLAHIKKHCGEQVMLDYVMLWIILLNKYLGNKFSDEQIKLIANDLYQNYHYAKIADLKYLFERIKRTQLYHITPQAIILEAEKYFNDRINEAVYISQRESIEHKSGAISEKVFSKFENKFKAYIEKTNSQEHERKLNKFRTQHIKK